MTLAEARDVVRKHFEAECGGPFLMTRFEVVQAAEDRTRGVWLFVCRVQCLKTAPVRMLTLYVDRKNGELAGLLESPPEDGVGASRKDVTR